MKINVGLGASSYDIIIERGALARAAEYFDLSRKIMVITDDGVPEKYAKTVASACREGHITVVPQGEGSKSFAVLEDIQKKLLSLGFTRGDAVVAVGGGVVGDLSGFAASIYMRGIDFYNIPTTLLSQVDSSVGGKTAINLDGVKNIVGTFYQPKRVLIDPDVLETLSPRQISEGLAEAIKMSLTCDSELFELFESGGAADNIERVIERSIKIKARVVEKDERESGLRKILNFGHTIGHGIESFSGMHGLYHGECVALGMIPMCSEAVRERLIPVLTAAGLPTKLDFDAGRVKDAMAHDKKAGEGAITVTCVEKIGSYVMKKMTLSELEEKLDIIKE